MKDFKSAKTYVLLVAILGVLSIIGCSLPTVLDPVPAVTATVPSSAATSAAISAPITATFNKAMDPATITADNFTVVAADSTPVTGTVTYDVASKTAIFTPAANLEHLTTYTATITTGVMDSPGKELGADKAGKPPKAKKTWTFKTAGVGPASVGLGTAGNYVILAKTGISTVPTSDITGDIGLSPAATSFVTGFGSLLATSVSQTSAQVTGHIFAADMTDPTPANLTTAVLNMQAAYTDAAGRPTPDFLNLGAGNIGGLTLVPGLYKWGTTVTIPSNVTLSGAPNDVWIFQVSGGLTVANAAQVILSGGAQAKNIFWQVASGASLGTTSHFEGIILCQTAITLATGATMNGRALAQTAVTLQSNALTQP